MSDGSTLFGREFASWSTRDPSIATMGSPSTVWAWSPGTTSVDAAFTSWGHTVTASAEVTVTAPPP